jgi:hypothetical protein
MAEKGDISSFEDSGADATRTSDEQTLNTTGSKNKETIANISPESKVEAQADIEHAGVSPKPVAGGVNPADFPDGGGLVRCPWWMVLSLFFFWLG